MLSFDFKKSSRRCSETGRDFQSGELFYSALVENESGMERKDFGADLWKGPPENCIGWWKSRVPELGKGKIYWAPKHVLLAYFEHVLELPDHQDVSFVVALLLLQKRILNQFDDGSDPEIMELRSKTQNSRYQVKVVDVEPNRLKEIQEELSQKLFMDEPVDPDEEAQPVTEQAS